ncbi:hypothetical protein B0T22DRAFT_455210 [Podospora appendiculata]|uniref:Secreted protein n=1 Tax=Podospora appendiculata TaxID=314037 RepID=A0AAE1CIK8_9PEZI|nr:hypothetical protein B0T22DRAFT_455210 [Podospora appendiculata]
MKAVTNYCLLFFLVFFFSYHAENNLCMPAARRPTARPPALGWTEAFSRLNCCQPIPPRILGGGHGRRSMHTVDFRHVCVWRRIGKQK